MRARFFIALIAPVILLIIYGYAVTFDIKKIDFSVVDRDGTALSRSLVNKFTASGYFDMYMPASGDMDKSVEALRVNKVRIILSIPDDFSKKLKHNKNATVQVIADGADANTASVALGYCKIIIATFSQKVILDAVKSRGYNPKQIPMVEAVPRVWYNPELRSQNFIVPGLIAIIMMLIAATLTSLTVVREKERGTFEQLISTPVKPLELMAGKLAPYVLIGFVDTAIVTTVGLLWFHVPFRGDLLTFLLFVVLFVFCAMGLGLFMSSIAKEQSTAVIGTLLITILPSILLSGFVFPIDSMPKIIQPLTYIVPARYFLTALRSLFLKADVGLFVLYKEALFLLGFGILFLVLSAKRFRKAGDEISLMLKILRNAT